MSSFSSFIHFLIIKMVKRLPNKFCQFISKTEKLLSLKILSRCYQLHTTCLLFMFDLINLKFSTHQQIVTIDQLSLKLLWNKILYELMESKNDSLIIFFLVVVEMFEWRNLLVKLSYLFCVTANRKSLLYEIVSK